MKKILKMLPVLLLVISTVAISCGSADLALYTKVKPSGDTSQRITITGSGMIGNLLTSNQSFQEFQNKGWKVSTNRSADSVTLTATKDFAKGQNELIPNVSGNEAFASVNNAVLNVKDMFFFKEYDYSITLKGSGGSANLTSANSTNGTFASAGAALAQSMLSLSWTVELPGKILETNADEHTDNTATWHFNLLSFNNDRTLMVRSRNINAGAIGIAAGAVAVCLSGSALTIVLRRKKKAAADS